MGRDAQGLRHTLCPALRQQRERHPLSRCQWRHRRHVHIRCLRQGHRPVRPARRSLPPPLLDEVSRQGRLVASVDGVFYIPCYDHNGNIVRYVSEAGNIAAQYTYDPYGNVIEQGGDLADAFAFGFSTKYRDHETGLVAYQRRFYSPGLGRWLNRDPIGATIARWAGASPWRRRGGTAGA